MISHAIIACMAATKTNMKVNNRKSQRTGCFNGGIKTGTTAFDKEAKTLDRIPLDYVRNELSFTCDNKFWRKGYSEEEYRNAVCTDSKIECTGLSPDGGIFLDKNGKPLLAVESKKQGKNGNAIERWYKNYDQLQALGCKHYLTFCYGDGFYDGNTAERILGNKVVSLKLPIDSIWDTDYTDVVSFRRFNHMTENDLRKEIYSILDDALKAVGWDYE